MLDDWDDAAREFVKVFPADYKRVLAEARGRAPKADEFAATAPSAVTGPHGEGR